MPIAYRLVEEGGRNKWKAFDMPWSNLNIRHSAVRITREKDTLLTVAARQEFERNVHTSLPTFPSHWSNPLRSKWRTALKGITIEWGQLEMPAGLKDQLIIRLEWKSPEDTPADADWEYYSVETLAKLVIPKWKSGQFFKQASYEVQIVEIAEPGQQRGFELVEQANKKLAWIQRRDPDVSEVRRHPGNSLVLLVDEAASFLNPEAQGGGVPNLELFRTFVREAPGMRVFFFTAGSDFATDLNILSVITKRVPAPIELNPFRGLNEISLPSFTQGKRLSFEDIIREAGELLQEGDFNAGELYKLRNASKGLLSVATASNRDYFAEVINLPPVEYNLPVEHAEKLRAKVTRVSALNFAHAIINIDPDNIPAELLLRNQAEYNPSQVLELMINGDLLPGAKALLLQLRRIDFDKHRKQAVYSTLRNDSQVIDLYASVMQAAGYRWVQAKKRTLDRSQWSKKQDKEYQVARENGTLPPELRSVYLDFQNPLEKHAFGHNFGPLNPAVPHDFLVLSESLIVSDTEAVEPTTFAELRSKVVNTTDTLFNFRFTLRELRAAGLVPNLPDLPPDAPEEEVQARQTQMEAFKTTLTAIKKIHLHLWPGKAHAQQITQPSVLKVFEKQAEPSFFVMKLNDGVFQPLVLDDFLTAAGFPSNMDERFVQLKAALLFNFTMSEYEQRDLLAAITENWNNRENAEGARARIVLYGGNYLQGFDLADSLASIALHPSNRADEIQARGRTNRRNGMPNIPFLERRIHHSTLVAKWPHNPVTVGDVFPMDEMQMDEEDEFRYGRLVEEKAVISSVYEIAAAPQASRALNEDDPLEPYQVWRCKTEAPSVTAFRQAGDLHMQDFALDKPFSTLVRDVPDAENPDSEVPIASWVLSPTQWALKKSSLQNYWANLTDELQSQLEAAREKALEGVESDEDYLARLTKLARTLTPAFDTFPDALKAVILNGLKPENPQKVVSLEEPQGVKDIRDRRLHLQTLIEAFGEESSIRLLRRLALEPRSRFLLLELTPRIVVSPRIFETNITQLLEHLVRQGFASWSPDIRRIKTQAEIAVDGSSHTETPPGELADVYFAAPILVSACPTPAEVAEARKFTREVRPYSNALEALGILDDEQDKIEEHDGKLEAVLSTLGLWKPGVQLLNESQQIDLIYGFGREPPLLKDAIIELSKFGLTNWRRALFCIASVYASERLNGTQTLRFVAQLIGALFYTVRDPGFEECFAYAREFLMNVQLNQILEFSQLLFQWNSLYTPWDRFDLSMTFGMELHLLLDTIQRFQEKFGLDLLISSSNLLAFKKAMFVSGKSARALPELNIDELAKLYGTSKRVQLAILPQYASQWSGRNLRQFYTLFRATGDYEQARQASRQSRESSLADRYYAVFEIFSDEEPLTLPDPEVKWTTRRLIADVLFDLLAEGVPQAPHIQALASVFRHMGLNVEEASVLLEEVLDLQLPVEVNRERLSAWIDRFQSLRTTMLSRGNQTYLVAPDGQLVVVENGKLQSLDQKSLFLHFKEDGEVIVARVDAHEQDAVFIADLIQDLGVDPNNISPEFYYGDQFKELLVGKNYTRVAELLLEAKQFASDNDLSTDLILKKIPPYVYADVLSIEAIRQLLQSLRIFDEDDLYFTFSRSADWLKSAWKQDKFIVAEAALFTQLVLAIRDGIPNPSTAARFEKFFSLGAEFGLSPPAVAKALGRGIARVLAPTTVSVEPYNPDDLYNAMATSLFASGRKTWFDKFIKS